MNALTQSLLACVRGVIGSIPADQRATYYPEGLALKNAVLAFSQKTYNELPDGVDTSNLDTFHILFRTLADSIFPDPPPPVPSYTQYPPGHFGSYPRRRKTRRNRTR